MPNCRKGRNSISSKVYHTDRQGAKTKTHAKSMHVRWGHLLNARLNGTPQSLYQYSQGALRGKKDIKFQWLKYLSPNPECTQACTRSCSAVLANHRRRHNSPQLPPASNTETQHHHRICTTKQSKIKHLSNGTKNIQNDKKIGGWSCQKKRKERFSYLSGSFRIDENNIMATMKVTRMNKNSM